MISKKISKINYPVKSIKVAIDELKKLPGVGQRLAERIVDYIMDQGSEYVEKFANIFHELSKNVKLCKMCFGYSEQPICFICSDNRKLTNILCIVQYPRDILKIESLNEYNGLYFVLGNIDIENIEKNKRIEILKERLKNNNIKEIILASCSDYDGSYITTFLVEKLLLPSKVKISQLAIGIPFGYPIEFIDTNTLSFAFKLRKYIN